jgi:hypothetical protein
VTSTRVGDFFFHLMPTDVNPHGSSLLSLGPSSPTGPKSQCSSTPLESSPTHSKHTFDDLPFGYREITLREFAVHASTIHMQNKTLIPDGQRVNSFRYREFLYREIGGCGVVHLMQHKTPNPETPMPRGFHYISWSHTTTSLRDFADRESTTQSFLGVGNPKCRYVDALDSYHLSLLKSTALINSGNRHSRFQRARDSYFTKCRSLICDALGSSCTSG